MDNDEIAKNANIEPFLVTDIKDVSKDPDMLKLFLESIAEKYNRLDRVLIKGGVNVRLSHDVNLNYARAQLEDVVVEASDVGGLNISGPKEEEFVMRVVPVPKGRDAFTIRNDAFYGQLNNALEIRLNSSDKVYAEITAHPDAKVYLIQSVGRSEAVKLRDSHFWQEVGKETGLVLTETDPLYKSKEPITPWYRAVDEKSNAVLTMGWRWRVDEIGIEFETPVPAEKLDELFGAVETTKYVNGEWTNKDITSKDGYVKSFVIHSWKKNDVVPYVQKLLELARQKQTGGKNE